MEEHQQVTLVSVAFESDGAFLERFPRMLAYYTPAQQVAKHVVVLNCETREGRQRAEKSFGSLPWLVDFFQEPFNRCDLPAYNDAIALVQTPVWIGISPDTRLFDHVWIPRLRQTFEGMIGLVGPPGPCADLGPKDVEHPQWGWVPRLLVERNLPFDSAAHVQTWCFAVRTDAFKDVGGFWETPEKKVFGKGDLIAAEVYLSVSMRQKGYEVAPRRYPMHHYGTRGADNLAVIEQFDRARGWEYPF
jgi:hypothetical protein